MRPPLITGGPPVRADAIIRSIAFAIVIGSVASVSRAGATTLFAQSPAGTDSSLATVEGVIVDSLRGGYLPDAIIAVTGTPRMATTDSFGRFRIDSIQPGTRRIDVFHTRLDELGLALVTPLMELKPGDSVSLILAFPSATTIMGRLCGASDRARGPAGVFGQVLDADHETPVAGARLFLEWIEYKIVRKRIETSFERRSAVSASDGHFGFCGLPPEVTGSLSASSGGDTTAKVGISIDPILATRTLHLAPPGGASTTPAASSPASAASATAVLDRGTASVTGKIVNSKGGAVARARVAIDRLNAVALSGEDGRFALHGVRPGTRALNVRRLGFEPVEIPLDVTADSPKDITVRLADFVPTLDTIVVTAMRGLDRVGFSKRRKAGMGTYLTPEQVNNMHAFHFVDLFSSVPMLRRAFVDGREILVGRPRGWSMGCINYFVDDMPWTGGGIEDFIIPAEVGAIEVYAGAFVPAQFVVGLSGCGTTVAVWTKPKLGIR